MNKERDDMSDNKKSVEVEVEVEVGVEVGVGADADNDANTHGEQVFAPSSTEPDTFDREEEAFAGISKAVEDVKKEPLNIEKESKSAKTNDLSGDSEQLSGEPEITEEGAETTEGCSETSETTEEGAEITEEGVLEPDAVPDTAPSEAAVLQIGFKTMEVGSTRFGITATGAPLGAAHWLADSSLCGEQVMALPSSLLVLGRTPTAGSVAVDTGTFLDAIIEGASRMCGLDGIVEAVGIPKWAVTRLMGSFPAFMAVYHEAMDQAVLTVEAAAYKAAIGFTAHHKRRHVKSKQDEKGKEVERTVSEETLEKTIAPDPSLSRLILSSRMKERYKDDEGVKQAVQINIIGPEADL